MLIVKPHFFTIILLIFILVAPQIIVGQSSATDFQIEVKLPGEVKPDTSFDFEVNIKKDIHNEEAISLSIVFPKGFIIESPDNEAFKFKFDGSECLIWADKTSPGEALLIKFKVSAGNLKPAAFPIVGSVWLGTNKKDFQKLIFIEESDKNPVNTSEYLSDHFISLQISNSDAVTEGQEFRFVTTILKTANYNKSGQIKQKFIPGFEPLPTEIIGCDFVIRNNEVTISWSKMVYGETMSIAYDVSVGRIPGGVYPVITRYSDETGFAIEKSIALTVGNNNLSEPKSDTNPDTSIYKISLDYPQDISQQEKFDLKISVQKGKNTGPGSVELNLNSSFLIEQQNNNISGLEREAGKITLNWSAIPANPVFEVPLTIISQNSTKAVYPISAGFYIEGKLLADYIGHIYISDSKITNQSIIKSIGSTINSSQIDTTTIFSKIDNLLNDWKAATNNPTNDSLKPVEISSENSSPQSENKIINNKTEKQNLPPDFDGKTVTIYYRIQIVATKVAMPDLKKSLRDVGIDQPVNDNFDDGMYRYTIGEFGTLKEAKEYLIFVKSKGYNDAFVAEFINGKRGRIY